MPSLYFEGKISFRSQFDFYVKINDVDSNKGLVECKLLETVPLIWRSDLTTLRKIVEYKPRNRVDSFLRESVFDQLGNVFCDEDKILMLISSGMVQICQPKDFALLQKLRKAKVNGKRGPVVLSVLLLLLLLTSVYSFIQQHKSKTSKNRL